MSRISLLYLLFIASVYAGDLELAVQSYESGDFEKASELYKKAYIEGKANPAVLQNLALSYYNSSMPYHAYGAVQKGLSSLPRSAELQIFEASLVAEFGIPKNSRPFIARYLSVDELRASLFIVFALLGIALFFLVKKQRYKLSLVAIVASFCLSVFIYKSLGSIADSCLIEGADLYPSAALADTSKMELKAGQCAVQLKTSRNALKINKDSSRGWISKAVVFQLD